MHSSVALLASSSTIRGSGSSSNDLSSSSPTPAADQQEETKQDSNIMPGDDEQDSAAVPPPSSTPQPPPPPLTAPFVAADAKDDCDMIFDTTVSTVLNHVMLDSPESSASSSFASQNSSSSLGFFSSSTFEGIHFSPMPVRESVSSSSSPVLGLSDGNLGTGGLGELLQQRISPLSDSSRYHEQDVAATSLGLSGYFSPTLLQQQRMTSPARMQPFCWEIDRPDNSLGLLEDSSKDLGYGGSSPCPPTSIRPLPVYESGGFPIERAKPVLQQHSEEDFSDVRLSNAMQNLLNLSRIEDDCTRRDLVPPPVNRHVFDAGATGGGGSGNSLAANLAALARLNELQIDESDVMEAQPYSLTTTEFVTAGLAAFGGGVPDYRQQQRQWPRSYFTAPEYTAHLASATTSVGSTSVHFNQTSIYKFSNRPMDLTPEWPNSHNGQITENNLATPGSPYNMRSYGVPGGFTDMMPGTGSNQMQIRCKFGQLGTSRGMFNAPHGFCLGINEEIIVADTNNHRIQIFDTHGSFYYHFGIAGKDEGFLFYPRKIAVLRGSGNFVICDRGGERSRMQIFSSRGHFVRRIAIRFIDIVAGLAISKEGHIVAVDSVTPTVFIISERGDLIRYLECSEFMTEPSDIAVFGSEYYICDFKGHSVVVVSEEGQFLRRIGSESITPFPNGIDISDAGDVLIGDSHGNQFHVAVFSNRGQLLSQFTCPNVKVSRCCGLKITSDGYVVTLAKNNHHVLVLNTLYVS